MKTRSKKKIHVLLMLYLLFTVEFLLVTRVLILTMKNSPRTLITMTSYFYYYFFQSLPAIMTTFQNLGLTRAKKIHSKLISTKKNLEVALLNFFLTTKKLVSNQVKLLNLFPPGDDYQVPGPGGKNDGDAANVAFTKLSLKQNLKNVRAIFLYLINIRPFCVSGVEDTNPYTNKSRRTST